jgi:hypothetical protein
MLKVRTAHAGYQTPLSRSRWGVRALSSGRQVRRRHPRLLLRARPNSRSRDTPKRGGGLRMCTASCKWGQSPRVPRSVSQSVAEIRGARSECLPANGTALCVWICTLIGNRDANISVAACHDWAAARRRVPRRLICWLPSAPTVARSRTLGSTARDSPCHRGSCGFARPCVCSGIDERRRAPLLECR